MNQYAVSYEMRLPYKNQLAVNPMKIVASNESEALRLFEKRIYRYRALDTDAYNIVKIHLLDRSKK